MTPVFIRSGILISVLLIPAFAEADSKSRTVDQITAKHMDRYGIPGAAIAVVNNGVTVHNQAYGLASVELGAPITSSTLFQLSSTTKMFSAMTVLALVEDGTLDLEKPARHYLPQLPAAWGKVTLRHLLSHQSGLPDILETDATDAEAALEFISSQPQLAQPGDTFFYNQSNYFILKLVMEKVTGTPFQELVAQRIFRPAGMTHTVFAGNHYQVIPGRATSYYPAQNGTLQHRTFEFPEMHLASAGINSSAEDLIRLTNAISAGRILKPETLATMWTPPHFNDGQPSHYALGWDSQNHAQGFTSSGHEGGGLTTLRRFHQANLTVIVLCNGVTRRFNPDRLSEQIAAVYEPKLRSPMQDLAEIMLTHMESDNPDHAIRAYQNFVVKHGDMNTETMINRLGYTLLGLEKPTYAVSVLKLNVDRYPQSPNAYDSLGEAWLSAGEPDKSKVNYQKVLEIRPTDTNAKKMLARIAEMKPDSSP